MSTPQDDSEEQPLLVLVVYTVDVDLGLPQRVTSFVRGLGEVEVYISTSLILNLH